MIFKRLFGNPNQELEQDNIKFCLNKSKKPCSVIGTTNDIHEVFIPSSIQHGAKNSSLR